MPNLVYPVILSGGSGKRLWPLSRRAYPKQLLALAGPEAMLQETAARVDDASDYAAPLILCNEDHRFIIAEQLRAKDIRPMGIVLEPMPRNTAPALTAAALMIFDRDPEAVMLALPSDHVVRDLEAFHESVELATAVARTGKLVTFGVIPERAETGFGYLQRGAAIDGHPGAFQVTEFAEKPDQSRADAYLASGEYSWNSGMFVLPVGPFIQEVERLHPDLLTTVRKAVGTAERDHDFTRLDPSAFAAAPSISIDHAIMERTELAAVVPVDMGWSDIGSWAALWDVGDRDGCGNVVSGDVVLHDVENCLIRSEKRLVAGVGIRDLVIVETDDAVLVTDREQAQHVQEIVASLERSGRSEANLHARVSRPWGTYQGVAHGERFQVKQIMVKPGEKLSLQMHHHRAEHWIVVEGTAVVTNGDETFLLTENQSTYIPVGVTHRLENPGEIPLLLIEVQSGNYLGEDDIVRFEDIYGRHAAVDDKKG